MTKPWTPVPRRTLLHSLILSVALFVIATTLGDKTHGIGKHHPTVAIIGDVFFAWFVTSVVTFIALVAVFLLQNSHGPHRHA